MIISRWLTLFVLAAVVCGVVGCGGGGLTQAELKRRAFRRSSDDEEVDAPAPAKNAPPKDDEDDRDFGDDGDRRNIRAQGKEQVETKEEGPTIPEPTIPENLRDFDAEGKRALRIEWNIEEIGKAVQRHNKKFPSLPIGYNRGKSMGGWKPFLSWRVHLLPALGYQELYDKFNLDEPWNSPHNRALLKEMPPVYDCGLDKYRTTILALQRGLSTVWGTHKYVFHSQVEDGLDSTLIAQDCKDEYAVEWTRPLELDVIKYDPLQAISGRRFVLFANGSMGQLRQDVSPAMMLGLVTISGGEAVSPWEAVVIADADEVKRPVAPASLAENGADGDAMKARSTTAANDPSKRASSGWDESGAYLGPTVADAQRIKVGTTPVPSEAEQLAARRKARQLFEKQFLEAKRVEQRAELANFMLRQSGELTVDSVDRYVVLDLTIAVAAGAGELDTALKAVAELQNTFATDLFEPHYEALDTYVSAPGSQSEPALDHIMTLLPQAVEADEYKMAEKLLGLANKFAVRVRGQSEKRLEIRQWKKRIAALSSTYDRVKTSIETLSSDPANAIANRTVGLWLCLVRDDWEAGLPLLAKSDNEQLVDIAGREAQNLSDSLQKFELAELWWTFAEKEKTHQVAAYARAAHWYEQAMPGLTGLERLRAELQLKEYDPRRRDERLPNPDDDDD